jgi:hypothetical protein
VEPNHLITDSISTTGMYVDLRLSGLFQRNLPSLSSPKLRDNLLGQHRQIQKDITQLKLNLDAVQATARSLRIRDTCDNEAAESLGHNVTHVMLSAGKACTQNARLPVSPTLHAGQNEQRILLNRNTL